MSATSDFPIFTDDSTATALIGATAAVGGLGSSDHILVVGVGRASDVSGILCMGGHGFCWLDRNAQPEFVCTEPSED